MIGQFPGFFNNLIFGGYLPFGATVLGQEEQQVEKKRERARCWCFTQWLYSSLAHVVVTGAPKKIERRQTHGGFTKNSSFFFVKRQCCLHLTV